MSSANSSCSGSLDAPSAGRSLRKISTRSRIRAGRAATAATGSASSTTRTFASRNSRRGGSSATISTRRTPNTRMLNRPSASGWQLANARQTGGRMDRRPAVVVLFPAGGQQGHGDQAVAGQRLLNQLAIARLEHVQRLHHVRKHHQIGQRKQPGDARELLGRKRQIAQIAHHAVSPMWGGSRWISGIRSGSISMRGNSSVLARTSAKQSAI